MKPAKKSKFELPAPEAIKVACRACGEQRDLDDFRLFSSVRNEEGELVDQVFMDFCTYCEKTHGTLTLYRRYNAYGTAVVSDAVFKAANTPEIHRGSGQVRLLVVPPAVKLPETNEEMVKQEIARRELSRRRLLYFVKEMMPSYLPGWFHQDICRRLEKFVRDVEDSKSPRLIIAVPPRHGKSQLASDMFPSWVLGKHPDWPLILASYAQELPVDFSRNIRDRMADPGYKAIFPETKLRSDARGVEAWKTTQQGGVKAIGVGGGLTGFGGKILIADDLIKDSEAAQSELILQNTWNWYQMVFRSRLAPGGGILLIGTRWHWFDPTGRALSLDAELAKAGVPAYERENWDLVSYPAIAEGDEYLMPDGTIEVDLPVERKNEALRLLRRKDEALHPERYPRNEMVKIRNTLTTQNWSALYQQKPTPDEGNFFKKDDFRYRWLDPAYRPLCRIFMAVDYAIGKKQRNDYTVAGVFALDSNDDLYLLAARRGRWGTHDIARNIAALVAEHKPELYAGEQGALHHAVWPDIKLALDAQRDFVSIDETLVPIQDKETRARPLQGRMQRHKVFFSYDEATKPEFFEIAERELLQFPEGQNDDIVDMMAWGARLAMNISLPNKQQVPAKQKSWKDKLTAKTATTNHMAA